MRPKTIAIAVVGVVLGGVIIAVIVNRVKEHRGLERVFVLKDFTYAFHAVASPVGTSRNSPPVNLEEIKRATKGRETPHLLKVYELIESGQLIVLWEDVELGNSRSLLCYERSLLESGGFFALGDGLVLYRNEKVTEQQLKKDLAARR